MSSWTKSVSGRCQACGTPWSDHLGPTALCDNLHRRDAEIKQLRTDIERLQSDNIESLKTRLEDAVHAGSVCVTSLARANAEIERLKAALENSAREESEALTQVERFSVENGRLVDENKRLIGSDTHLREEIERLKAELAEPAEVRAAAMECSLRIVEADLGRARAELAEALRLSPAEFQRLREEMQADLADARKAAESLYTSLLAGEGIISREEIIRSALEKWPWLGPAEPKLCPHEAARQYTAGVRPEQSSEATKIKEDE